MKLKEMIRDAKKYVDDHYEPTPESVMRDAKAVKLPEGEMLMVAHCKPGEVPVIQGSGQPQQVLLTAYLLLKNVMERNDGKSDV